MATYNSGYIIQANPAETPALTTLNYWGMPKADGVPIWEFGLSENVLEREIMGQYYKDLEAGVQNADMIRGSFLPTNMRFLYAMYGKRSASTGSRTIQHMDGSARKPRYAIWKQVNNDKRHVYGILLHNMILEWGKTALECTMLGKGMTHATDSITPTITHEGSIKSQYTNCSAMSWAAGGLTPYGFRIASNQPIEPIPSDSGYQAINEFAAIGNEIDIIVGSTDGETMIADKESSTPREFIATFAKGDDATKTITLTITCRIKNIGRTEMVEKEPIYNIKLVGGEAVWTGDDGL